MQKIKRITLSEMKSGECCTIKSINAKGFLLQKLLDMGFITNSQIHILREAPLYDPMELKIQGYNVSLRKSEANMIEVVPS